MAGLTRREVTVWYRLAADPAMRFARGRRRSVWRLVNNLMAMVILALEAETSA